ncbi:hypothetical protein J4Q44_G00061840 [Coregonus suidteri]|uniref:Uncharacterized protein n=1 Tax=Coregonus suidteri TaxID=861788 RepID=A0AAN8MH99_9TELE
MVFILAYYCLCTDERGTFRHLEIAPKDEPDLWRYTTFFQRSWLIYFDFPMMSSKEALSLKALHTIRHHYLLKSPAVPLVSVVVSPYRHHMSNPTPLFTPPATIFRIEQDSPLDLTPIPLTSLPSPLGQPPSCQNSSPGN